MTIVHITGTFRLFGFITGVFSFDVPFDALRHATSVQFCIPTLSPISGGPAMAGTVTFTDDHIAHVPVKWSDDVGLVHAPSDAAVTVADPSIATAAFNTDMTDVDITPVSDGSTDVTVSSASLGLTDTMTAVVGAPSASSVELDAADATFTPKP